MTIGQSFWGRKNKKICNILRTMKTVENASSIYLELSTKRVNKILLVFVYHISWYFQRNVF